MSPAHHELALRPGRMLLGPIGPFPGGRSAPPRSPCSAPRSIKRRAPRTEVVKVNPRLDTLEDPSAQINRRAAVAYAAAGLLLAAYACSLLIRPVGHSVPFVDNQLVDAFEIVMALGCLASACAQRTDRVAAVALGAGLLAWALGDVLWTVEGSPSGPSAADAFYIAFYPLAYLALVTFIRSRSRRYQSTVWLDGAIAGLGAAAIAAAFAFDTILGAIGGSPTSVAVNLAYPIGDLILLALAVGALVVVPGWPVRLLLFAAGCALMAIGDTVYLVQSSGETYQVGTLLDLTWPAAMFVMSLSVWVAARTFVGRSDPDRAPRFVLPALASAASLAILMVGNYAHVSGVALSLAAATLLAVGARMAVSLRILTRLTDARRKQAITDELTGLGNRRHLLSELDRRLDSVSPRPHQPTLALLLIDLDHFKEINDSFGHPAGDAVLQEIGPRLRSIVRPGDVVARLGGDEFAVILDRADMAQAVSAAERLTAALEEPIVVETTPLHVGASIGIALAPTHAHSSDELVRCADVAMYRAKGLHLPFDSYEAALDDGADRLLLMEDLRVATEDGTLTLHYQPEIDLRTGEVVTCEALLRWTHPRLGLVPPEQFLNLAQECGLTRQLTAWVLDEAIRECARWWATGHRAAVAVNLLATDLLDEGLPRHVAELLEAASLPPTALVLEITEQMLMPNLSRAMQVIEEMASSGVIVSIDDFGTGFSSLARLSELRVGELKLDRTFTGRLLGGGDDRDLALISSSIDLGHALGMRVVAEGIERIELVDLLLKLGCERGQGFAVRSPAPADCLDFTPLARGRTVRS
jgi:diguanylate cyclase (GGDEF)-like protein